MLPIFCNPESVSYTHLMMAIEGKGLEPLGQRLREAHPGNLPKEMAEVEKVARLYGIPQGKALLLLEGDLPVAEELGVMPGMKREALYQLRRERVNAIVTAVAKACLLYTSRCV